MQMPTNFGEPSEDPHRSFRNMCIEFKKLVKHSKNINELSQEMQKLIDESRHMDWHVKSTGVYRKAEGEKITGKIFAEFKRYVGDLQQNPTAANTFDLINALEIMEQFVGSFKVT